MPSSRVSLVVFFGGALFCFGCARAITNSKSKKNDENDQSRHLPPIRVSIAKHPNYVRLNVSLNGNQPAQNADCYGFRPASGAELGENRADVELHGVFRDVELRSHLLISLPKSN